MGNPLFGKQIDAVFRNNKRLAIEIGGIRTSREIRLVFVWKSNGIDFKGFIQKWFLADSQNMEILSVNWDVEDVSYFQSDFAQGLNYTLRTVKTEDQKQVVINFRINP